MNLQSVRLWLKRVVPRFYQSGGVWLVLWADVVVRTEVEVEWKSVYRKVRFASFGCARPKCTMTIRRGDIIHTTKFP